MNQSDSPVAVKEIEQRRRAVRANPRNAQAHAMLGMALQKHGHFREAVKSQRRALELDSRLVALHGIMAAALYEIGEYRAAADHYSQALKNEPHKADLQRGLSEALRMSGESRAALDAARQAAALNPGNTDILIALSQAQLEQRDFEGAIDSLRQVIELAPEYAAAWSDIGRAEHKLQRYDDAMRSFTRALSLDPDNARTFNYRGICERDMGQRAAAEASFRRAAELEPESAKHWRELGIIMQLEERGEEALEILHHSQKLDPNDISTLRALAYNHFETGHWDKALDVTRHAMACNPAPDLHSSLLFMLSHTTLDPEELKREHFNYATRWEAPLRSACAPHRNDRDPQRKIRVGFVSADLRNHAVARFIEPIFGMLCQSDQLEFFVYFNHVQEDEMTQRLRSYMPNWRNIAALSDSQAESMIRADAIDILIDLSGHSGSNRLPLFARKPAPIQASWIGYAGTTGLQAMDYYISDQFHLPEGRYDDQFTEKIVRLPLSAPFLPPPVAPDVNLLPALTNSYITFGSFHRSSKISRATIALWGKLLRSVPTSRLLLGGQRSGTDQNLLAWLDEEGIDRDRILIRQRAPVQEYMAQHREVDVCLSPFPYSGSTTICYALWMGVPTLVTIGPTNPSHSAVCYLAHLGLSSFLADDDASFVALGSFLAQNPDALAALRSTMRERFNNSVVGYPGVTAVSLEYAFRQMWRHWCAGDPAAPLRVRLSDLAGGAEEST